MDNIEIRVVTIPVEIAFTCPHCFWENSIDFDDFKNMMISEYPGDWEGQTLKCEDCNKELNIEDVEWD